MRHDAFLSYSHSDAALARDLERGLEKLAKPLLKLRALDVFRDETSLASSPALWPSIVEHLRASEWFLFLCSTQSARSPWCAREIAWWREHKSADRFLVLVGDGEIAWDAGTGDFDFEKSTAIPPALGGTFTEEPLYTDLRWARGQDALTLENPRFREAVLNVAAPLRGTSKDELDGADVRQLRKNRRFVRSLFAAIAAAAQAQARVATSRKMVADSRLPEYALELTIVCTCQLQQLNALAHPTSAIGAHRRSQPSRH